MKPKTMILMVVAIACGLGASYMTSRLLAERGNQNDEQERTTILVAKKKVPMGIVIKNPKEWFEEKSVAADSVAPGALTSFDKIKDRQVQNPRRPGDSVSEEDLCGPDGSGAMGRLPEGYRMVGIRVNPESIAGGFAALPHSKVDIFSTVRRGDDKSTYSQLLLEDVLVLAADTSMIRDAENRATPANVVSLALKPEDVTKIRLAETMGPLSLALRPFGERKLDHEVKTTFQQIITGTAGRRDDIAEGSDPSTPPPFVPFSTGPSTTKPEAVTKVQQPGRGITTHRVSIFNGQLQVFWEFTLDEQGKVIDCREVQPGTAGTSVETRPATPPSGGPARPSAGAQ